jgi:hypothetical protein
MSSAMKGHRMVFAPAVMCFFQELLTLESSSYLTCLANVPPAITSCGHHMSKHCLPHSPQDHNIGTNLTPQQCCHAKMLQSSVSNDVPTGDRPISNKSDVVSSSLGLCLFLVQQIHMSLHQEPQTHQFIETLSFFCCILVTDLETALVIIFQVLCLEIFTSSSGKVLEVTKYTFSPIITLMSSKMPPYSQLRKPGQGEKLPDKD